MRTFGGFERLAAPLGVPATPAHAPSLEAGPVEMQRTLAGRVRIALCSAALAAVDGKRSIAHLICKAENHGSSVRQEKRKKRWCAQLHNCTSSAAPLAPLPQKMLRGSRALVRSFSQSLKAKLPAAAPVRAAQCHCRHFPVLRPRRFFLPAPGPTHRPHTTSPLARCRRKTSSFSRCTAGILRLRGRSPTWPRTQ